MGSNTNCSQTLPGPPWVTSPWARQKLDAACKWPGVLVVFDIFTNSEHRSIVLLSLSLSQNSSSIEKPQSEGFFLSRFLPDFLLTCHSNTDCFAWGERLFLERTQSWPWGPAQWKDDNLSFLKEGSVEWIITFRDLEYSFVILVWCTPDLTRKGNRGWCHLILYGIKTKILPIRPIVTIEDMLLVFAWFARSLTLVSWEQSSQDQSSHHHISVDESSTKLSALRKLLLLLLLQQETGARRKHIHSFLRRVRCRCCRCGISVYLICETLIAIEWLEPGDPSSQLY